MWSAMSHLTPPVPSGASNVSVVQPDPSALHTLEEFPAQAERFISGCRGSKAKAECVLGALRLIQAHAFSGGLTQVHYQS